MSKDKVGSFYETHLGWVPVFMLTVISGFYYINYVYNIDLSEGSKN